MLNVPEAAAGRRLKCPHCASKFSAPAFAPPKTSAGPGSSRFAASGGPGSSGSIELPTLGLNDGSSGTVELPLGRGGFDLDLPTSSGPLRDTFDLPMFAEDTPRKPGKAATPAAPSPADVLALFQDEPKSARKPKGAEARAKARRCTSCSNVVPAGMSLCSRCGLDLDTGQRIAPLDIIEEAEMPDAYRPAVPPMGVLFVGSLAAAGFMLLSFASLIAWTKGMAGVQFLLLIWMFGIYGATQFVRRKSIRPLFTAVSLAAGIGAVFLILMPIYDANMQTSAPPARPHEMFDPDAPDIRPLTDHLDLNKISLGIVSLLGYAAFGIYLNTPGLRRQFKK